MTKIIDNTWKGQQHLIPEEIKQLEEDFNDVPEGYSVVVQERYSWEEFKQYLQENGDADEIDSYFSNYKDGFTTVGDDIVAFEFVNEKTGEVIPDGNAPWQGGN
jgi:hypothetical protein